MAIKPILFNADMVQAILDGQKTQTRRIVKKKYINTDLEMYTNKYGTRLVERQNDAPPPIRTVQPDGSVITTRALVAIEEAIPPYRRGDILWVRETWAEWTDGYAYKANNYECVYPPSLVSKWKPSIHMPKEAARIFLRVKNVRAERVQDISLADCKAEGIWDDYKAYSEKHHANLQRAAYPVVFKELWNSTIKKDDLPTYGWEANPWVWVIEFERCEKPKGWCDAHAQ
ncbi:MAG: hypothetical protein IJ466_07200 [Clostridia bacterium]|nr:hypothetical protein [Clostridia bacterium]